MTPPLSRNTLNRRLLLAFAVLAAAGFAATAALLGLGGTAAQGNPNLTCAGLGLERLAKYEFQGNSWHFENLEGTSDIITFATPHSAQDQAWTSSEPIGTIILKGPSWQDEEVIDVGGATAGTFQSPFLNQNNQVQDISYVDFCAGQVPDTPTNTPTNTATNTPTSTATNTPTNTATNTPTAEQTIVGGETPAATPTNTPTPIDTVLAEETPGTTPTPVVGSTGTGLQSSGSPFNLLLALLGLLFITASGAFLVAGRRTSRD